MALSTNMINNALLEQYALQVKNNNSISNKNAFVVENEKSMQESAFQTMLIQMMDSSGNSMMAELMSTSL